ncbi:MAG: hypothetical protein VW405_00785 [Rhodospirillaceae bacterium]
MTDANHHRMGAWYRQHVAEQSRALNRPMPRDTKYRGERYTAAPENDVRRYADMMRKDDK